MKSLSSATLWIVLFLIVILLFMNYSRQEQSRKLDLMEWISKSEKGEIVSAKDLGGRIEGEYLLESGKPEKGRYTTEYIPGQEAEILKIVVEGRKQGLDVKYTPKPKSPILTALIIPFVLPMVIIVGLWLLFMRQIQGSGNKAMSFGKSRARLIQEGQVKVTFKDVAGVEEAREELTEIVDYLRDPKKYSRLGGRIPKGVLLVGPPGTGKTLLAKAIAGEANVPFFSISGSDFVEMFVGVGASRVRDLFEQAKKARPCIVFIDEIDAVGRSRFAGIGGSHDEREQTLNQLLVEMDGFQENEGVILIAATNRPDVLDQALLRPGRFDRQVMVDLPDLRGREQILKVHARKVKMDTKADLDRIARVTPGFSGADLANLINEAALLAARDGADMVGMTKLEEARDRVMMGPERRSLVISEKEKKITAYHEAGHAIVAHVNGNDAGVHKITIIPRGMALGVTWFMAEEEKHGNTRQELLNILYRAMGGRAAEEIVFGEYTNGASSDIDHATKLAHKMICVFGMSEKLGPRAFGDSSGHVFLGKEMTRERNYSEETAAIIDEEIKVLIDGAYKKALDILRERRASLDAVAMALIERETLDRDEFIALMEGRELPPLKRTESPPPPPAAPSSNEAPPRPAPKPFDFGNPHPQPSA